jgi:hypothetical protein
MLQIHWVKSTSGTWLSFDNVNLENVSADGVYIIWHTGNPGKVVYVGQGDVAARIKAHRNRPDIMKYAKVGSLKVTWASVPSHQKDGVERYLANKWNPLVGDAHPDATPIAVNSPW